MTDKEIIEQHAEYNAFIEKCRLNPPHAGCYSEVHHIIPQSVGGSWHDDNVVRVTLLNHIECHRILARMGLSSGAMAYAYAMMTEEFKNKMNKVHLRSKRRV
jgi:hypothetical protein